MVAITEPKKKKLNKHDAKLVAALDILLNDFKKNWGDYFCKEYNPECSACQHYVFRGHLENYKAWLIYE